MRTQQIQKLLIVPFVGILGAKEHIASPLASTVAPALVRVAKKGQKGLCVIASAVIRCSLCFPFLLLHRSYNSLSDFN